MSHTKTAAEQEAQIDRIRTLLDVMEREFIAADDAAFDRRSRRIDDLIAGK